MTLFSNGSTTAASRVADKPDSATGPALAAAVASRFRMPGTPDPQLRLRRLAGIASWGALLGFGGFILVLRIVFGLFTTIPGWYVPTIFALGLVGLACTVGAFASVHRDRQPWLLLGAATVTLLAGFVVTANL